MSGGEKTISFFERLDSELNDGKNSKAQVKCVLNRWEQTNSLTYWSVSVQSRGIEYLKRDST